MTTADFLSRLKSVRQVRDGEYEALCPGHLDTKPSLSIKESDGKTLLHCFGGCELDNILQPLNLEVKDLFLDGQKAQPQKIVAVYQYTDANGKPFEAVRFEPKDFAQRRPDGAGDYIWDLKPIVPTLYHEDKLGQAIDNGTLVSFVEGEKDADRLWGLGLVATTNPMGAGKWKDRYTEALSGADLVIIPDNDKAGREHAQKVAKACYGIAQRVRVLELPCESMDVSDWLDNGGDIEQLKRLVETCPEYEPGDVGTRSIAYSKVPYPSVPQDGYPLTDFGNAERLVNQHGQDIRYCFKWGKWLIWNGKQWKVDETDEIVRRGKETARSIYHEVASCGDDDKRKEIAKWAKASQFEKNLKAMISMAKSEPSIPVEPSQLDSSPWLLNMANGTIDLRTGKLCEWQRNDLITKMLPIEYDPAVTCPIWAAFLDRIMGGNQSLIDFLRRVLGYSLTGDTSEQALFIAFGLGANGKTVFVETIKALLRDYAATADFSTFLIRNSDAPRNDLANLVGTRFVAATETESGKKLSEAVIKQVTGGDEISCRFLYHEPFSYRPRYKLFLTVNHRPIIKDSTLSIWRRIKLIPFAVTIPEAEQDKRLSEKLQGELPGILAWAVEGCLEWQRAGLGVPSEVVAATSEYRELEDILAGFLGGCCIEDENAKTPAKDLYDTYVEYCSVNGDEPIKQITFGKSLSERGFIRKRGAKGIHSWQGIGLFTVSPTAETDGTPYTPLVDVAVCANSGPGDTTVSVEDTSEPPNKRQLLAMAEVQGWPRLDISQGIAVNAGEEDWQKFTTNATQKLLEGALIALGAKSQ